MSWQHHESHERKRPYSSQSQEAGFVLDDVDWHGEWASSASPLFGVGDSHFPLLPKGAPEDEEYDEEYEAHLREQALHAGQNLTAVLNDPHMTAAENNSWFYGPEDLEPLVVAPSPYSEPSYHTTAILAQYIKDIGPSVRRWKFEHQSDLFSEPEKGQTDAEMDLGKCMKTVPHEYFDANHSVETSATFKNLAEAPKGGILLQEKLSQYLDLVEVSLLKQISSRSDHFFRALCTIQDLYEETRQICDTIQGIRSKIKSLHHVLVSQSMSVNKNHRKLANLKLLIERLEDIATIQRSQLSVKILLSNSDFGPALDMIFRLRKVLQTDLVGISCVQNSDVKLKEMLVLVQRMMCDEFVKLAIQADEKSSITPSTSLTSQGERLSGLIVWLLHMSKLNTIIDKYNEALLDQIKKEVKTVISDQLDKIFEAKNDDATQSINQSQMNGTHDSAADLEALSLSVSMSLGDKLKSLSHEEFMHAIENLFDGLQALLRRVAAVEQIITTTVRRTKSGQNQNGDLPHPLDNRKDISNQSDDIDRFQAEFHKLMCDTCEFAHGRCQRILSIRATIHAKLSLNELRALFDQTLSFVTQTETLCKKTFYGLRGVLLQQAKAYLEHFHATRRSELNGMLEKEDWQKCAVPRIYQDYIDRKFISPTESQVPLWRSENWDDEDEVNGDVCANSLIVRVSEGEDGEAEDDKFNVVQSLLFLLKVITEYIECATRLQAVGTDVLHRLLEILKLFNSRTCQLVLGAGAMQLAGLKTITTKHLSLSSQCLGLVIHQLPVIRQALASCLPKKHHVLLNELERIKKDYCDHVDQVFEKIVEIMEKLVQRTCAELNQSKWATGDTGKTNVDVSEVIKADDCVIQLMKNARSLRRVLAQTITPKQTQDIFNKIAQIFSSTICKYLSPLDLSNPFVRQKASVNVSWVLGKLRTLGSASPSIEKELGVFISDDT